LDDIVYTAFIANMVVLGWLGKQIQEAPYVESSSVYLAIPIFLQISFCFYLTYLKK
jgi:quinol-cytochrome oxidoreductase complex cytochrome b subunit